MVPRFPAPLRRGDRIAVTAPSAGVSAQHLPRLEFCIEWLRLRGFEVVVGECMSGDAWVSAPKERRAAELTAMLVDPSIRAVVPPWGGAGTALDLLDQLDYARIAAAAPTWVVGYSDSSTWMVALTLRTGLATLHGDNLMDTPFEVTAGLAHWLDLAMAQGPVIQRDTGRIATWGSFAHDPTSTRWVDQGSGAWRLHGAETLDVTGALIGGCIDTLAAVAGTAYGDVRAFGAEQGPLVIYLEAADEPAFAICRNLHHLRYCGWFDHAVAILIGRTTAPDSTADGGMTQGDAVLDALSSLDLPIVFDLEIGHVPPHLPLLNAATARVVVDGARREITQHWPR